MTKVTRKALIDTLNNYDWGYSVNDYNHRAGAQELLNKGISKATIKEVVNKHFTTLEQDVLSAIDSGDLTKFGGGEYNVTNCAAYLADFCGFAQAEKSGIWLGETVTFHKV